MASVAPGLTTVPKINTLEATITILNKQASTYQSAAKKLSNDTQTGLLQESSRFNPSFGEFAKTTDSALDNFDKDLGQKRGDILSKSLELNFEKSMISINIKKELLELFFKSIKDGILTDKEKKKILQKLKEYKAMKNFLNFSYSSPKTESKGSLGEFIQNSSTQFQITIGDEIKTRISETFELAYKKIENNNIERDNLAAADNKISDSELSDQSEGKAELAEIKELGSMILEAL